MKKLIFASCAVLLGALCLGAAAKRALTPAAGKNPGATVHPMGRLVVHEWGTFTGFAGSDGVHLPFEITVGADLPAFVMNRQTQAFRQDPILKARGVFLKGGGAPALQRMETPVVYFYPDAPGDVNV